MRPRTIYARRRALVRRELDDRSRSSRPGPGPRSTSVTRSRWYATATRWLN